MEFGPDQQSAIKWVPRSGLEVVEEHKIKYVCDQLTYKVLSNVRKSSFLSEWVQKRLREGRMYYIQEQDVTKPTRRVLSSQWKPYIGKHDPSGKIDQDLFRYMNLKHKVLMREIIRDSTRGFVEISWNPTKLIMCVWFTKQLRMPKDICVFCSGAKQLWSKVFPISIRTKKLYRLYQLWCDNG